MEKQWILPTGIKTLKANWPVFYLLGFFQAHSMIKDGEENLHQAKINFIVFPWLQVLTIFLILIILVLIIKILKKKFRISIEKNEKKNKSFLLSVFSFFPFLLKKTKGTGQEIRINVIDPQPLPGGGMPAEWLNPPTPPAEGFGILINQSVSETNSRFVTLTLRGGPNTERMAISNFSDF